MGKSYLDATPVLPRGSLVIDLFIFFSPSGTESNIITSNGRESSWRRSINQAYLPFVFGSITRVTVASQQRAGVSGSANTAGSGRAHVNDNSCSDSEKGDGLKGGGLRNDLRGQEGRMRRGRSWLAGEEGRHTLWLFCRSPRPDGLLKSFGA